MVYVTPDIEEATRYYRDILGFRAVEHTNRMEEAMLLENLGASLCELPGAHLEVAALY